MIRKFIICTGFALLLLTGGGCDRGKKQDAAVDAGPDAASVGDESISVAELNGYIEQRLSGAPGTIDNPLVQRYLQELVTTRSLAQEARRQQLDQRPDIRRELDQLLAGRLLEEQVIRPVSQRQISDEEIVAFYEEHKKEYSKPEQVRLGDIFIAAPEEGDPELREKKREEAEAILQEALAAAGKRNGFSSLVREHSDQHQLYRLGDTGFFDRQGDPKGFEPALVEAAFMIPDKGAIYDKVVVTKHGFHIVMLISRRSATEQSIEKTSAEIRQRIRREEMTRKKKEYITSITDETKVKIDRKEIETLVTELQKARKPGDADRPVSTAQISKNSNMPPMIQESGKE